MLVTLPPEGECEGSAFGYVCLSTCVTLKLSLRYFTKEEVYPWFGSPKMIKHNYFHLL